MPAKYYLKRHIRTGEPTAVYRFFSDEKQPPEFYKRGVGWVGDTTLWAEVTFGDLDDEDVISDEEAAEVVKQWGGTL
jgi:hypothetical protein